MVCMAEAVHTEKISYEHDFDKDVWMVVWSACEVSGLGKTKYTTFGSTNGREGWKIGPGPKWIMSSLEDIEVSWEFPGYWTEVKHYVTN